MRKVAVALILLLCGAFLWAETTFYIEPVVNWSYADIQEFVITHPGFKKLSQLDWDAHNVMQFGVKTEIIHNNFVFAGDFAVAPETECGYMQDMDWMYLLVNNPDHLTNTMTEFSEHEITLVQKNRIQLKAGWKVFSNKTWSLILGGGFQYQKTYLDGHDGYLQHSYYGNRNNEYTNQNVAPYNPNREKVPVSGHVISYQQEIESLWFDIRADFILSPAFSLRIEGGLSPWQLIDCDDYHFVSINAFVWYYDNPVSTAMYRGLLSLLLNFGKRSSLVLSGAVLSLPYADGNSFAKDSDGNLHQFSQIGATNYFGWDVSLSYRIRIF